MKCREKRKGGARLSPFHARRRVGETKMKSRTKFRADFALVSEMFAKAGLPAPESVSPLGAGEFNTVLSVVAGGKKFALKIAPSDDTPVLRHEKGMMKAEVYWYDLIRQSGAVAVPEVIFSDFSHSLAPADWFVMTQIEGVHPTADAFGNTDPATADMFARTLARINNVHGEGFGYVQGKRHDDWYHAIRAMVCDLLDDAADKKRRSRRGEKLLGHIDRYADILSRADCRMVNFDLWVANVILPSDGAAPVLIDPERTFWGDRVADFVCMETSKDFRSKTTSLAVYNAESDSPVEITDETAIRNAVAYAYLALIQEVEKYYRYTPLMFGWWRNVFGSAFMFSTAFKVLDAKR